MIDHASIIRSYLDSGLSIIPIKRDGSKMPTVGWTEYETRLPTAAEVDGWLAQGIEGWALVCGQVSGNVEAIDFDDMTYWGPWAEQVDPDLLKRMVLAITPGDGRHVIYKCATIGRNQKLARYEGEDGKPVTAIETRGEGGIIVVEPTTAAYHLAHKPYKIAQGSLLEIPEITPEERAQMLDAAKLLNEYIPISKMQPYEPTNGDGGNGDGHRPGDDFAEHADWRDILEPHGWKAIRQRGDKVIWQRPGKDGPGGSAQTGGASAKTGFSGLYVYSSNAFPLESDHGYGKFSAYATLNHGGDYYAAAADLRKQGYGPQVLIREAPVEPKDATIEMPEILLPSDGAIAPTLPEAASVDPAIGKDASAWLTAYTALSRQWSPRAFDDFHLACGLWLLSTVAARRAILHLGGPRYSNLYIALVARTSLWAKSTTAKIVTQTLNECGLSFLLAPDDSTPQKFISDLTPRTPGGWKEMNANARDRALVEMGFAAARGWFFEEFGMKIDAMLSPSGFMSEFRGILRAFDDCPETYRYASIGRGTDNVERPYVSMLGNMTPADLQRASRRNDALWQDGFWARWAFVTPPASVNSSRARFPLGERSIPAEISEPIKAWHLRLGIPAVEMQELESKDKKGKETVEYVPTVFPMNLTRITMTLDAREAFYAYHDGLLDLVEQSSNRDFDGNYARFAEKALRIAILVASLEHNNQITLPVWALAQSITERWRQGLHELYAQANAPEPTDATEKEELAIKIISKLGEATANDVARYMWKTSSGEAVGILEKLADAGALIRTARTRRGTIRYAIEE
jgi:hypothetical protein